MSETDEKLAAIRARIDALDKELQRLISERAACARDVARLKASAGDTVFYRPEREAQILRAVMERNSGDMPPAAMATIFREIMSACLALEKKLSVAFLGPEGTFSQQAVLKHFGHGVDLAAELSIDDVFHAVETGRCDYGVVPIENSTEGGVSRTMDMFITTGLRICGEVILRVNHHLLSRAADLGNITVVYGHQQALAQCRGWLDTHLPAVQHVAVSSNGDAAQRASDEPTAAAIASDTAAEIYQLGMLASNIEDQPDNTTRFLVVSKQAAPASGKDKTSLMIATGNQPGALYRLLSPLERHGISMTRIESRPSRRGTWDYVFFVDIEGHLEDTRVAAALAEIEAQASSVKVLGAYPCAVIQ